MQVSLITQRVYVHIPTYNIMITKRGVPVLSQTLYTFQTVEVGNYKILFYPIR